MAIFPGAVATDAGLYVAVNNLSTALTDNPLTIGATTVNVVSTTGFPTAGAISIGAEIIFYTGTTPTSFTGCTRGADGTSAAAHALNDQVDHNVIAFHHNVLKDEIIALETFISTHIGLTTAVTAAEFERLVGVTSSIQTQLNARALAVRTITAGTGLNGGGDLTADRTINLTVPVSIANGGTNSTTALSDNRIIRSLSGQIVEAAAITANRALASDANGIPVHTAVTDTELGRVSGVTSPIQTQLDGKVNDTGDTMTGDLDMSGNDVRRVATLNDTFLSAFRNRHPNGEMRFDHRNAGANYTINNTSLRTLDMWAGEAAPADGVFTVARQTSIVPTGFRYAQLMTVTTADASVGAAQDYDIRSPIEGYSVKDFLLGTANAKQFTVSFWVRSSLTGTFGLGLGNSAFNRSYVAQYTINAANTWEYKTITLTGDTTGTWLDETGTGLRLQFDMGSGSNTEAGAANTWSAGNFKRISGNVRVINTNAATWAITGVQVELGGTATAFEYLPEMNGLHRIQRYVEKSYAIDTSIGTNTSTNRHAIAHVQAGTTVVVGRVDYKVQKRVAPTVVVYTEGGTSGSMDFISTSGGSTTRATTISAGGTNGFQTVQSVALDYLGQGHWYVTAEL